MAITDPILSWLAGYPAYSRGTLVVYGSMLLYVLIGRLLIGSSNSPGRIAMAALAGSTQFFLITSLFVWIENSSLYPHTWAGLLVCYAAAIPFFSRTLLSDLLYSGALFTCYALLRRREGLSLHAPQQ